MKEQFPMAEPGTPENPKVSLDIEAQRMSGPTGREGDQVLDVAPTAQQIVQQQEAADAAAYARNQEELDRLADKQRQDHQAPAPEDNEGDASEHAAAHAPAAAADGSASPAEHAHPHAAEHEHVHKRTFKGQVKGLLMKTPPVQVYQFFERKIPLWKEDKKLLAKDVGKGLVNTGVGLGFAALLFMAFVSKTIGGGKGGGGGGGHH